jgi:hypothetical protein
MTHIRRIHVRGSKRIQMTHNERIQMTHNIKRMTHNIERIQMTHDIERIHARGSSVGTGIESNGALDPRETLNPGPRAGEQ